MTILSTLKGLASTVTEVWEEASMIELYLAHCSRKIEPIRDPKIVFLVARGAVEIATRAK